MLRMQQLQMVHGKYQITYSHSGGATVDILIHHIDYKPDISNNYLINITKY